MGEGRLRRETVEGFPLFVGRRGPSLKASAAHPWSVEYRGQACFAQRRGARREPAFAERSLVVRRIGLEVTAPRVREHLLTLQQRLVVRLVLSLPDACFLERHHAALVVWQHPRQVLACELEALGAGRAVLVSGV